jgi:Tfp pilus assembly protein PilV
MRIAPRSTRRAATARAGFTVIEVMVAVMVLTTGLIASAAVMSGVSRREMLSSSRIDLMTIADSKMEELRGFATTRSADTLQLAVGGSLAAPLANHADSVTTPDGVRYRRLWVVTAGPAGTRSVTVRVTPVSPRRIGARRLDFASRIQIL